MLPFPASRHQRPNKVNVCAVVVSFFPEGDFLLRLHRVQSQVDCIVIVDNSTPCRAVNLLQEVDSKMRINVISNGANLGLSAALNQGLRWAAEHGYTWALTLDQDSIVAGDILDTLSRVYEDYPQKETLAVIGSNYIDPILATPSLNIDSHDTGSWLDVKTTITSGSLISLPVYHIIGPFREELFIDCVDFEYCLRARRLGFRIIMTQKPLMTHAIGNTTTHKLPWKTTTTSNHSPLRRYFMTRNQIALARDYLWVEPSWTASMLYRHVKGTVLMCLFEKDIFRKLSYTLIGVLDGITANFHRKLG